MKDEITAEELPAKIIQIQAVRIPEEPGYCGPHVQVYALCEDGSMWIRYVAWPGNNVPTDGLWREFHAGRQWITA